MARYQNVHTEGNGVDTKFVLFGSDDSQSFVHEVPVQAVGDRMELFGTDINDTMTLIGMAARAPHEYDQIISNVVDAYKDMINTEVAAVLDEGQTPKLRSDGRDPAVVVSLGKSTTKQVDRLNRHRRHGLESLHVYDQNRDVTLHHNNNRMARCDHALNCEPGVAQQMRNQLDAMQELITGFRVHTAVTMVPRAARAIDAMRGHNG